MILILLARNSTQMYILYIDFFFRLIETEKNSKKNQKKKNKKKQTKMREREEEKSFPGNSILAKPYVTPV